MESGTGRRLWLLLPFTFTRRKAGKEEKEESSERESLTSAFACKYKNQHHGKNSGKRWRQRDCEWNREENFNDKGKMGSTRTIQICTRRMESNRFTDFFAASRFSKMSNDNVIEKEYRLKACVGPSHFLFSPPQASTCKPEGIGVSLKPKEREIGNMWPLKVQIGKQM